MRNLKRALSLTLASVMLLGMMVVGSSAAAGYDDVDVNDNVEAIEVLQAVEVMVGDDRGFGPDRPVTRNEMAVVMGKLLNLDYNYYASTCPFTDVADWAKGWVGACAANGIVSGRGNGIYDGEATVTAVEAASMMMRTLGYFKYQNDYADGFITSTVRQGTKIGIFDMVGTDGTTAMTRNQVAQMALNALQTGMVEPDGNTINLTTPDGSVFTGKVNYVNVTSYKDYARAISDLQATSAGSTNTGYIVELGEQLYNGDLKLYDDRTDEFGRPARQWEYKGNKVGTYAKKELLRAEYTKEVTGLTLYDLLGNDVVKANSEWDIFVYIDGENRYSATNQNGVATMFDRSELNKNNKAKVGGTGNGVLTEVYVDADDKEVTIAIVNTYLAVAKADYNEKKDELTFEVHAINKDSNNNYFKVLKACENDAEDKKDMSITGEDFPVAKDIKENDVYLVNVAQGEIQIISSPELLDNTVLTAFKKYDWVETDGTKYSYASTAEFKYNELDAYTGSNNNDTINLKDQTYKVYLDSYGYLIGIELIEAVKNYVFITGVNTEDNYLAARSQKANAIFLDGTMETITYNVEKSDNIINATDPALTNTWCTYTVNNAGVYTLKQVVGPYDADGVGYKAGDSRVDNGNGIKVGQYHDKTSSDIDVKHVSLRGSANNGASGSRPAYKFVYGNDDTVYLNAKIKTVKVSNTTNGQGIITDVASVTTGIDNASLKLLDNDDAAETAKKNSASPKQYPDRVTPGNTATPYETAEGAYVLYNKDGYVIAAITVAKDSTSTKNLVYVNSSKAEEHYSSANDEWTWYREVVYNGEKVDLKEVGDGISIVENLKQHNWYVVSYNAKGEVISATHAYDELDHTNEYEDTINNLSTTINAAGAETVLYENTLFNGLTTAAPDGCPDYDAPVADGTFGDPHTAKAVHDPDGPNLKSSMFYVRTTDETGFYVDNNVKTVFIQTNRNGETTEIEEGKSALENFIDDLNAYGDDNVTCVCGSDHATKFCYEVSAVITGGRAKVVVIRDLHKQGDGGDKPTGSTTDLTVNVANGNVDVTGYDDQDVEEISDAIIAELESLGYTDVKVKVANGMISGVTALKGKTEYEFTVSGDIPSAASVKDALDTKAGALAGTLNVPGKDPVYDEAGALTKIQDLLETAVNDSSIDVAVAIKGGASFSAATNGTSGSPTGTAGTGFACVVTLSKNGQKATKEVTVTMQKLDFAETDAGKVKTLKDKIEAFTANASAVEKATAYTKPETQALAKEKVFSQLSDAEKAMIDTSYATGGFTAGWKIEDGTPDTVVAASSGTPAGTNGKAVVNVRLKSGSASDTATVTVTVEPVAYNTTNLKKVDDAKAAITTATSAGNAISITGATTGTADEKKTANQEAALNAVKTAVEGATTTGTTIAYAQGTYTADTSCVITVKINAANTAEQTVNVTVTIS